MMDKGEYEDKEEAHGIREAMDVKDDFVWENHDVKPHMGPIAITSQNRHMTVT